MPHDRRDDHFFRDLPLDWQPGHKYAYNNSGYFLLGVVIEKVTKKITFVTDDSGKVTELVLGQGGQKRRARRIR